MPKKMSEEKPKVPEELVPMLRREFATFIRIADRELDVNYHSMSDFAERCRALRPHAAAVMIADEFASYDADFGFFDRIPHVSREPELGDFLLEWWGAHGRKLSIYVGAEEIEAVKVWGPDPVSQMETVDVDSSAIPRLWQWIRGY